MCSFSTLSEVQPQAANDDAGLNKLYEIKCTLTNPPLSEFIKSRMSTRSTHDRVRPNGPYLA